MHFAVQAALAVIGTAAAPVVSAAPASERNFAAVLVPVAGGPANGFGVLLFRQPQDGAKIVFLDIFVLNLAPNHSYFLQRATDRQVDGDCRGTNWLTLGRPGPEPIVTNDFGFGVAHLFRNLSAFPTGDRFDIHFRVIDAATANSPTPTVVLKSSCHQFTVAGD